MVPIALTLDESELSAERFGRVAQLPFSTLSTADQALRAAFGFSAERPSRQIVALVNANNGSVIRARHLSNGLTHPATKLDFLRASNDS